MTIKVGIPQALLYHEFGPFWHNFFDSLHTPVKVSGDTNKHILDRGTSLAVDESCLPLKLYLGHTETLLRDCTHIFVPRIARYRKNFYHCAKLAGLPDIVRNTFRLPAQRIITPNLETNSRAGYLQAIRETSSAVGRSLPRGWNGFRQAVSAWRSQDREVNHGTAPTVAVVGHSYLLKDAFLCGDIFSILKARNVAIATPEDLPGKLLYTETKHVAPEIYWQLSAKIVGAATLFARRPDIAGIILVSSFGCGVDSLINEYIEHRILKSSTKPFLILNLDEHTGRAGMATRVEAFWDLVEWRAVK